MYKVEEIRVKSVGVRFSGFGNRDSGFGFRDSRFGIRDSGFGIRDSGFGIRVSGFRIRAGGSEQTAPPSSSPSSSWPGKAPRWERSASCDARIEICSGLTISDLRILVYFVIYMTSPSYTSLLGDI